MDAPTVPIALSLAMSTVNKGQLAWCDLRYAHMPNGHILETIFPPIMVHFDMPILELSPNWQKQHPCPIGILVYRHNGTTNYTETPLLVSDRKIERSLLSPAPHQPSTLPVFDLLLCKKSCCGPAADRTPPYQHRCVNNCSPHFHFMHTFIAGSIVLSVDSAMVQIAAASDCRPNSV